MARKSDKDLPMAETLAGPVTPRASTGAKAATVVASDQSAVATEPDLNALATGATIDQRYVVSLVLGRGGMGTVYLARDLSLGRDVALKLHRSGTGHERLYREAVAMAQLQHPNVVTVFEVGTVDDQLFVAMEYIRGWTLRDWVNTKPRTWREIVELLLDVGEGLAAAHRAGFVHRDFKPENVLVGEDGRPRVSDFGLARGNTEITVSLPPPLPPRTSSERTPLPLTPTPTTGQMTVTGTVLGTPAYMAPEQYAGSDVDARGDQFSFCVAAWESLFGTRPFAGTTLPQLQQAIERGEIVVPDGSAVPTSIRRVLTRGLAPKPEARWPDMAALMAALRKAMRPRTARWVIAAAVAVIVVIGGVVWSLGRDVEVSCDNAGADIDQLFPLALRTRAIELARTNSGADAALRTGHNLETFVASYRRAAVVACRAGAKHDWSDDLLERSRGCREEQARNVTVTIAARLEDRTIADRVVAATADSGSIADLDTCNDPNVLAAMPKLPPAERSALIEARAQLATARESASRGHGKQAKTILDRVTTSPIGSSPHLAGALALVRGAIARGAEDYDTAIREMVDAYYKAHADVDRVVEMEALRYLLYWIGVDRQDGAAVESWYRLALSEVDRYQRISPLRSAELRLALVGVAIARNELPVAIEQARLAVVSLENAPPLIQANAKREYASALAESGDHKHAIPLYEQSAQLIADTLGPDEIQLAELLGDEALTLMEAGRHPEAIKVIEHADAIIAKYPKYDGADRGTVELNSAAVFLGAGQPDRAEPLLLSARERYAKSLGPDNPTIGTIDSNLAEIQLQRGNNDQAITLLQAAIKLQEKSLGTDHPDVASTVCKLAEVFEAKKDWEAALESVRRCVAIRAARVPKSDFHVNALIIQAEIENHLGHYEDAFRDASASLEIAAPRGDFALTPDGKVEQARALFGLHRDDATARRVLAEARAIYAAHDRARAIAEIDALLAEHK